MFNLKQRVAVQQPMPIKGVVALFSFVILVMLFLFISYAYLYAYSLGGPAPVYHYVFFICVSSFLLAVSPAFGYTLSIPNCTAVVFFYSWLLLYISYMVMHYIFFSQYEFLDTNKKLVFSTAENLHIEICDFGLTSCYFDILNIKEYAELLQGKYLINSDNEYIFIGDKQEYITGIGIIKGSRPNVFDIENGVQLTTYGSMKVLINKDSRKVELYQESTNDRALISGGVLKDWHVNFSGVTGKIEGDQRFNQNLLTGCLTLLDVLVDNIDIRVEQALCEDGVNFMRVKGNVGSVVVNNAISDAIDVDFSKLHFKNIKVNSAGNDCIDLSAGDYQILDANLTKCKDKAVSVGEGSELNLEFVKLLDSNVGIVAKDSSTIKVKSAVINSTPTCFSAYNKKQEFWGAKIKVGSHNCQYSQSFQQKGSLIEFVQ